MCGFPFDVRFGSGTHGAPKEANNPPSNPATNDPEEAGYGHAPKPAQNPLHPRPAVLYVPSGPSAYVRGFGEEQRRGTRRHFAVTTTQLGFTCRVLDQSHIPHEDDAALSVGYGHSYGGGGGDGGAERPHAAAAFAPERRVHRTVGGPIGARAGRRRANLFV